MRYHPAIIAQSAATISILSNDRFVLGIGSEERLNEHVIGRSWPSVTIRHEMLEEAIDIIRLLWQGGYQSYDGTYFQLDDARIFDLPQKPIPFFIAAGGEYAAHIAADSGGGICVTEPETGIIHAFIGEGGAVEDTWGQAVLSWDSSTKKALRTAHNQFRFVAGGWKVQSELPNPINFDNATRYVRPEDLAEMISCGPSADEHMKLIQTYLDSGVHSLAVVYPGTNHEGFMDFWQNQLHPQLVAPKNTDPQEVLRGQKKKVIEPKERIIPED
jgi:G6PDH family F420-dependent oxidoreductase